MDDFGTGYSSLSYLHRLPLDALKMDREFVAETTKEGTNKPLAAAIVSLARSLELEVVAEGVESLDQLEHPRVMDCDYAQDFLFSRAVGKEAAELFLKDHPPSRGES